MVGTPSPIQSKAIKPMCTGVDIIAQAQSGTGKLVVFQLVLTTNRYKY